MKAIKKFEKALELQAKDPTLTDSKAAKKAKMTPAQFSYYKNKSKKRKKQPTITEIPASNFAGGKTLIIVTDDVSIIETVVNQFRS